ncbi:hypothetical protein C8Q72DRAFT_622429 [Fomitopsis betulina]|nr:hypothetical protein C8Q72DRAFT_622429 [Fomitopsis betulina]
MPLRVALGLLLIATIYLLYTFSTRQPLAVSALIDKSSHAVNPGLVEPTNMRPGGRWKVLDDLVDAPSSGLNSLYGLALEPIPIVHWSELHKRDSMQGPLHQPLHLSFDSQDDAQGRDVSTSHGDLLEVFRTLARKEREETRRRVGGKSKLRGKGPQITVMA